MDDAKKLKYLRIALILVGLISIVAIYPFILIWPSGWQWGGGNTFYEQMIVGVYATLGVFLLIASRDPMRHLSLIWFTAWSSLVHGVIMAIQVFMDSTERGHLVGDVPALIIIAVVLALLTPRASAA